MKTDELIALLATDAARPPGAGARAALWRAAAMGAALTALLALPGLGLRADLLAALGAPTIWLKWLLAAALAAGAAALLARLARPGQRTRAAAWAALAAPVALCWLAALAAYGNAAPADRAALLWGQTWRVCSALIVLLSLPTLAVLLAALRQLAPTRPGLTGACAGLLSGALAVAVYTLHCPETGLPFIAVWYVGGVALATLLGALLGPRVLRW